MGFPTKANLRVAADQCVVAAAAVFVSCVVPLLSSYAFINLIAQLLHSSTKLFIHTFILFCLLAFSLFRACVTSLPVVRHHSVHVRQTVLGFNPYANPIVDSAYTAPSLCHCCATPRPQQLLRQERPKQQCAFHNMHFTKFACAKHMKQLGTCHYHVFKALLVWTVPKLQ